MKKICYGIFLLCFLMAGGFSFAEAPPISIPQNVNSPGDVKPQGSEESNPLSWEQQNQQAPYTILLQEQQVKVHEDGSQDIYNHFKIKIQNPGNDFSWEMPIYYNKDKESVEILNGMLTDPDGKITPNNNPQDVLAYPEFSQYSMLHKKAISFSGTKSGSIVELSFKGKIFKPLINKQFWSEVSYPSAPTKLFKNTFIFPRKMKVNYKEYKIQEKPQITSDHADVSYFFQLEETESFLSGKKFIPPLQELLGAATFSSLKDWRILANWYRQSAKQMIVEDQKINDQVAELIKDKKSEQEKATSIIEFIQDHFRLVPVPFAQSPEFSPTKDVFHNQYADKKDWVLLTKQMLAVAGIKANICLLRNEYEGDPNNELPNPVVFGDIILEVFVDGEKYFVDPVLRGYSLGHLPSTYQAAYLFVITDDQYRFDHIPIYDETKNKVVSHINVFIEPSGNAIYEVENDWGVDVGFPVKEHWRSLTGEAKKQFYDSLDDHYLQGAALMDRKWDGLDDRYESLKSLIRFKKNNAFLLLNDTTMVLNEKPENRFIGFDQEKRKYPIYFPINSVVQNTIVYHIPANFKIDSIPENYDLKNDILEISRTFESPESDKSTIKLTDIYRTKRGSLPKEKYPELQGIWEAFRKNSEKYIILKKTN